MQILQWCCQNHSLVGTTLTCGTSAPQATPLWSTLSQCFLSSYCPIHEKWKANLKIYMMMSVQLTILYKVNILATNKQKQKQTNKRKTKQKQSSNTISILSGLGWNNCRDFWKKKNKISEKQSAALKTPQLISQYENHFITEYAHRKYTIQNMDINLHSILVSLYYSMNKTTLIFVSIILSVSHHISCI